MSEPFNLLNRTFTRLTVIANCSFNKKYVWVNCSCGKELSILCRRAYLLSGDKKSCGCLQWEVQKNNGQKLKCFNKQTRTKYKTKEERRIAKSKIAKKSYINNREKCLKRSRDYFRINKTKEYERNKIRAKTDLNYRLKCNIRNRLQKFLKDEFKGGRPKTAELVGCSLKEFRDYIASKFTEGMSWDNYGKWHIDHIIPLSYFNVQCIEDVKKAMHYTNCQPMWASENSSKGNRYSGNFKGYK